MESARVAVGLCVALVLLAGSCSAGEVKQKWVSPLLPGVVPSAEHFGQFPTYPRPYPNYQFAPSVLDARVPVYGASGVVAPRTAIPAGPMGYHGLPYGAPMYPANKPFAPPMLLMQRRPPVGVTLPLSYWYKRPETGAQAAQQQSSWLAEKAKKAASAVARGLKKAAKAAASKVAEKLGFQSKKAKEEKKKAEALKAQQAREAAAMLERVKAEGMRKVLEAEMQAKIHSIMATGKTIGEAIKQISGANYVIQAAKDLVAKHLGSKGCGSCGSKSSEKPKPAKASSGKPKSKAPTPIKNAIKKGSRRHPPINIPGAVPVIESL